MTNNSIFTKVLALMICFVMLVGTLTACFQETEHNHNVGTTTTTVGGVTTLPTTKPTTTTPTTTEKVEDEPVEEPVDPNEIFSASTDITSDSLIYGTLANDLVIGGVEMGALVPADVKVESGASSLALSVKKVEDEILYDALSNLDVHIDGIALDNTVPMVVKLGAILEAGLGATELKLYHTENGVANLMTRVSDVTEFAIHNQYYYDAETGEVTIYVASFSVFYALKSEADVWDGKSDTTWYNENDTEFTLTTAEQLAGFRDLVDGGNTFAGKTVKLGVDIDLKIEGDDGEFVSFDPIGYGYNTVFSGTFDGGNHTIYNLYQNGWELGYSYGTQGGGLFASVVDATIKNLVISDADIVMECVDMGIVVGYAYGTCTFENIVITNSTIANYNRYTGAVVGEVNGTHTFTNVTVDSSVVVSSLWGSFDTSIGGVIGGKWGNADITMTNVTVAALLDVYSDVTAAYQWYAYRRCGMLIGHTEVDSPKKGLNVDELTYLHCTNVNVYYSDWVNYTYYQFANQDSPTGQRYPWVRAEASPVGNNGAFSNPRYGVPTHTGDDGVTITVNAENADTYKTGFAAITFDQLYGGGQGVYGKADHTGVETHSKLTKTIYVNNNLGWENLKLHYWFMNGEDTWTTVVDGIDMSTMLAEGNVYKLEIPAYAYAFKVVADGQEGVEFVLADLKEKEVASLCKHEYDNTCDEDCNVCGEERDVEGHIYDNACDADCNVCGATRTVGDHNWSVDPYICSECGYKAEKKTIYFQNNWLWTTVKVNYSGKSYNMTYVENDGVYDIYTITLPAYLRITISDGTTADNKHTQPIDVSELDKNAMLYMNYTDKEGHYALIDDYTTYKNKYTKVTLQPTGGWKSDNARFAAYVWVSDANNKWIDMVDVDGDGKYTCWVPNEYKNIKFCRMNPKHLDNRWNTETDTEETKHVWNETNNLTVTSGDKYYLTSVMSWVDANTKIYYLKPNDNWKKDGARFAVYFFNNSTNKNVWVDMVDPDFDEVYACIMPTTTTYANIIFCRMSGSATANNWSNKWNQTGDLGLNSGNTYSINSGSWDAGKWSTVSKP